MTDSALLWLLSLLPLTLGGILLMLSERSARTLAGPLAILAAAGVTALSVWAWIERPEVHLVWLPYANDVLALNLSAAASAAPLALMVAMVSLLILIYSQGYLEPDEARTRFFGFMALFMGGMELLVLADDLLTLLLGWELVGMCSYALIGFWHSDPLRIKAAQRAFITTRSADLGLYLAVMAAFIGQGRLGFAALADLPAPFADLVALGVIIAAAGKSAQLPFTGWLSGAMQGPTPVSALLHSATMVAAGAIAIIKVMPLLEITGWALPIILWVGVATALIGGVIALHQDESKQLLAASTTSQYGYIFAALGAAGVAASITHLVNHAAFKGLLFLCAGVLVHQGMKHYREMGGLRHVMPVTAILFAVVALSLAALPPAGGFFSKETILEAVFKADQIASVMLLIASLLTAAYAARFWFSAFAWRPRSQAAQKAHDPQPLMRWPMYLLALAALLLGVLALPPVEHWWTAALDTEPLPPFSWTKTAISLAFAGVGVAWVVYRHRRNLLAPMAPIVSARLAGFAEHWFGLVGLLDTIGRGVMAAGRLLERLDRTQPAVLMADAVRMLAQALATFDVRALSHGAVEQLTAGIRRLAQGLASFDVRGLSQGVVGRLTASTKRLATLTQLSDRNVFDGALAVLIRLLQASAGVLTRVQTGLLHQYYLFMTLGAGALLIYAFIVLGG